MEETQSPSLAVIHEMWEYFSQHGDDFDLQEYHRNQHRTDLFTPVSVTFHRKMEGYIAQIREQFHIPLGFMIHNNIVNIPYEPRVWEYTQKRTGKLLDPTTELKLQRYLLILSVGDDVENFYLLNIIYSASTLHTLPKTWQIVKHLPRLIDSPGPLRLVIPALINCPQACCDPLTMPSVVLPEHLQPLGESDFRYLIQGEMLVIFTDLLLDARQYALLSWYTTRHLRKTVGEAPLHNLIRATLVLPLSVVPPHILRSSHPSSDLLKEIDELSPRRRCGVCTLDEYNVDIISLRGDTSQKYYCPFCAARYQEFYSLEK